jgi:hypothetical protein
VLIGKTNRIVKVIHAQPTSQLRVARFTILWEALGVTRTTTHGLKRRQKVSHEVRPDGSVVMRPVPGLDELFGSIRLDRSTASTQEEKQAVRNALALDSVGKNPRRLVR